MRIKASNLFLAVSSCLVYAKLLIPSLDRLMNLIKRLFTSVIAGTLLLSSSFNHVKASDREVRIYSGRHYNTDKQIYKQFAEETGIKIRLIEATGISLVERLKREGSNSKADVILLVDAARISNAAKSGLLQSYRSSKLDKNVPVEYRDPQARWYALTRRVRVMGANPKKVDINSIKDYSDLANPSLDGLVCVRKRSSPYNQSLVANQIVNKGEAQTKEWLKGMISNISQPFFPGDIGVIRAVAQGKCGVGIVNHYYVS